MSSPVGQLSLDFEGLEVEDCFPRTHWEVLLRITADFAVCLNGSALYEEVLFPVVEFAAEAARWLALPEEDRDDFVFSSVESEESGLVQIRRGMCGWRVGSVRETRHDETELPLSEVERALQTYLAGLDNQLRARFGIDLYGFVRAFP